MPAKYLTPHFDPVLITSQIFLIFSTHYLLLTCFTILFNVFLGVNLHIDQILSQDSIDFQNNYGYVFLLSNFFTHMFMIAGYILIVDKANKILDYVLTNFLFHLIMTTLNSHFPTYFFWWVINGIFLTIVTLIAEYIALKLDQREIKLDLKLGGETTFKTKM